MASLMENLMDVLEEEGGYYDALLELSMKKTEVIVSNRAGTASGQSGKRCG